MKRGTAVVVMVSVLWLAQLAGCAAGRTGRADNETIRVEAASRAEAAVPSPLVREAGDKLVVWGWMPHQGPSHHSDPGHMHVSVRSSIDEELAHQQILLRERDTGTRSWRRHRSTYTAEFTRPLPIGSTVRVWHCHDEHDVGG